MSYLKFDKNLLINLDQSLPKEILRTNMAGSYHCTTVIGVQYAKATWTSCHSHKRDEQ